MSRAIVIILLLLLSPTAPLAAQTTQPPDTPPRHQPGFLPRFDFSISLEHLFTEDPRFVWNANMAGDLDLVDYGHGRITFAAGYETLLGSEFQPFDPLQGNYTLEGAVSGRVGAIEIAGVLHHVSRHLGDRPKRNPVDWNMLGGRVLTSAVTGSTEVDARLDLRRTVQKSFVDYLWEIDGNVRVAVRVAPQVALIAGGGAKVLTTDDSRGRGTQHGVRGEGGVRFAGRSAALELLMALERRVDPYQLEFSTATWLTAGFRLTSR